MATEGDRVAWTSLVLLERFRAGDDDAAAEIFDRYFRRLTALARSRLSPRLAQRTDPVNDAWIGRQAGARTGVIGRHDRRSVGW
jgi:hypothetical protein